MSNPAVKKSLNLTKLSQVAQVAVDRSTKADAEVDIAKVYSESQVRKRFRNLEELAESFKLNGIIEPLVVHAEADGRFKIIVGERRFRAAPLAGIAKVPVVIKRGLDALAIRRLQVAENNDRDDLSAFEQATGVIEDVERFGMPEALKIWNRGEAWVSKRMAVKRYSAPVAELLETERCGDFEVLHSLQQLFSISQDEFALLTRRLDNGQQITRDDARAKLAAVKEWLAAQPTSGALPSQSGAAAHPLDQQQNTSTQSSVAAPRSGGHEGENRPVAVKSPMKRPTATPKSSFVEDSGKGDSSDSEDFRSRFKVLAAGKALEEGCASLMLEMKERNLSLNEGEFYLWQSFVAAVGPLIATLGKPRGQAYLKRMASELRGKDAKISVDAMKDTAGVSDSQLGEMPEGWSF